MAKYIADRGLCMTLVPKECHKLAKQMAATCEITVPEAFARLIGCKGGTKADKPAEPVVKPYQPAQTVRQRQARKLRQTWESCSRKREPVDKAFERDRARMMRLAKKAGAVPLK